MRAILRDKQIHWPHFTKGLYLTFLGGLLYFVNNGLGISMVVYGSVGWSLAEILLGGDEAQGDLIYNDN